MQIERRALYNALRMNWQLDPSLNLENWQIENYRALPIERLFDLLKLQQIQLDRSHLIAIAENCNTPEELTDYLIGDTYCPISVQDQIYLIAFELWRRLVPEKPSLSIFCDELDHQINLFDHGKINNLEALQDALSSLQAILNENVDQGVAPAEVFATVSAGCAHDVETFLYDFIAEQIDSGNFSYAEELLDGLIPFVTDTKWFEFLRAQVIATSNSSDANRLLKKLVEDNSTPLDLEFNLELLSFMAREGDQDLFLKVAKNSLTEIKGEEDFQDLLTICADYYHYLDQEDKEQAVQAILAKHAHRSFEEEISSNDPDLAELLRILEKQTLKEKRIIEPHKK